MTAYVIIENKIVGEDWGEYTSDEVVRVFTDKTAAELFLKKHHNLHRKSRPLSEFYIQEHEICNDY